jgi:DNA-binding MarR family transcriptional regulator
MTTKQVDKSFIVPDGPFQSLLRVFGLIRRVMEPYFATFGISGAQWAVLIVLHRAKKEGLSGLRLKDIGDRLLIRPPSVTGVVDRLYRLGFLMRKASSADSRAKQVSLTPAGSELVGRILEGHKAKTDTLFAGLTKGERDQLQQLLDRISLHLEKIEQ